MSAPSSPSRHRPHLARSFWVILSITWGLLATIVSTVLPLWEARESLWTVTRNLFTCSTPTAEEDAAGEAVPGEFGKQVMPAPSFAAKVHEGAE